MSIYAVQVKERFYILKDITKNGKHSTTTIERLGTASDIMAAHNCEDAFKWAKDHALELDKAEREAGNPEGRHFVLARDNVRIPKGSANSFNVGYLPLQKIYYDLKIPAICKSISRQHQFDFDLDSIFSRLIYSQILFPGSKLKATELSHCLYEQPEFEYHQVLRALSVIDEHFDDIQSRLYRNSCKLVERRTGVVYYDCTNYYFEIEQEDADIQPAPSDTAEEAENKKGLRKYAHSKQHQPAPVVQVGLLMDLTGLPVAIIVTRGSRNEQTTMIPVEKKVLRDYGINRFIICSDAGLSGENNRKYNSFAGRAFITTVSLKKMQKERLDWCLSPEGWHLLGDPVLYDIRHLEDTEEDKKKNYDRIFYKETYIEGYDEERDVSFNQTLLVTYSLKYRDYTAALRSAQIERAEKAISGGASKIERKNQQDFRRFVKSTSMTDEGEVASRVTYGVDPEVIAEEAKYDGFYAMMHNIDEAETEDILKIAKGRWEIEESFRITKTDMKARPIYLGRRDRIRAHLLIVFISLLFYRILERKLGFKYTTEEILQCLRTMLIAKYPSEESYHPAYTRTDLTDDIHDYMGFYTDYERMTDWRMRGNCRITKGTSKRAKNNS